MVAAPSFNPTAFRNDMKEFNLERFNVEKQEGGHENMEVVDSEDEESQLSSTQNVNMESLRLREQESEAEVTMLNSLLEEKTARLLDLDSSTEHTDANDASNSVAKETETEAHQADRAYSKVQLDAVAMLVKTELSAKASRMKDLSYILYGASINESFAEVDAKLGAFFESNQERNALAHALNQSDFIIKGLEEEEKGLGDMSTRRRLPKRDCRKKVKASSMTCQKNSDCECRSAPASITNSCNGGCFCAIPLVGINWCCPGKWGLGENIVCTIKRP